MVMKISKLHRTLAVLLCLAGLSAGCENYIGDEVPIPDADLPSSGQLSLLANFVTTDSLFAIRMDRASNVFQVSLGS